MADEVPNRGANLDVVLATTLYYWCLQENKMIPTHSQCRSREELSKGGYSPKDITFKTRQDDQKIPSAIEFAQPTKYACT